MLADSFSRFLSTRILDSKFMKISITLTTGISALLLASCASGPSPLPPEAPSAVALSSGKDGRQLLTTAARKQGNELNRYREVTVGYDGEWSTFPKLTQHVLVDPDFRGSSEERYQPARGLVVQTHRGKGGEKAVQRVRGESIDVSYAGEANVDGDVKAAAAFVADAYAMFLFGSSWLLDQGQEFRYLGTGEVSGNVCELVEIILTPGLGLADRDRVIAFIDAETGLLRRVHFTMNGLESTQGAQVDVTFDEFLTASDGSVWPTHFVEMIRRPVNTKAHEWWTTSLSLDGGKVK